MVFPELESQSVAVLCQRDPQFHEFISAMKTEGFRGLMIIGRAWVDYARGKITANTMRTQINQARAARNQNQTAIPDCFELRLRH